MRQGGNAANALEHLDQGRDLGFIREARCHRRSFAAHAFDPSQHRPPPASAVVSSTLVIDDSMADIVAGGFDAGIRSGAHVHGDMIAVRLTPYLRAAVVASPMYMASRGLPATPHDLHEHRCINYRWGHDGAVHRWTLTRGGETLDVGLTRDHGQ
jgi:DNA-binding transcriptional LysR family regulator